MTQFRPVLSHSTWSSVAIKQSQAMFNDLPLTKGTRSICKPLEFKKYPRILFTFIKNGAGSKTNDLKSYGTPSQFAVKT